MMGRQPIGGIFSVGLEEPYRWKDSVQSEPEIRLWVAEGTANGMRPWVTKFSGVLYDRRWLPVVERHLRLALRARALPAQRSAAGARRRCFTPSRPTAYHPGVAPGDRAEDHVLGHVSRAHRGARPVRDGARGVSDRRIASIDSRLLILADAAALSDAQCDAIRGYVKRGGSLLATFATSLYDEVGRRRDDFGLADVFGVSFDGRIDGPMQNSYLSLETDPATGRRHPMLRGTRRHAAHHQRRVPDRRAPDAVVPVAADADSVVSGPADGGRLPARAAAPTSRELYLRDGRRAAASSTSRGTSTARSGT